MTSEEIADERANRAEFRKVFVEHPNGPAVLAWIGNELGVFSLSPEVIDPLMIAFWNRLLNKCGIVHHGNLFDYVRALTETANDRDLIELDNEMRKEDI